VAEQHAWPPGILLRRGVDEFPGIGKDAIPAVLAEPAQLDGGPAMAPVITGNDGVTRFDQPGGSPPVTAGVLAHAVGNVYDGAWRPARQPPIAEDAMAVASLEFGGFGLHGLQVAGGQQTVDGDGDTVLGVRLRHMGGGRLDDVIRLPHGDG